MRRRILSVQHRLPSGGPRYLTLAKQLRKWFQNGGIDPLQPLPSLRRLAAEFNVGLQIVRQALEVLESEGAIARNARKQFVLRSGEGGSIGMRDIVPIVQSYGKTMSLDMAITMRGMFDGLAERKLPALVLHGDKQLRFGIPPDVLDLPLKGILLYGQFSDRALRQYEKLKVPVVLVDQPSNSRTLRSISLENVEAARDATARIIAMGHRRIGLLRFLPISVAKIDPDSRERQQGFMRAAAEAGISHADARIYTRSGSEMAHSRTIQRLLTDQPRVTALLTVDAVSAKCVLESAVELGISIPRDLSLVTFHSQADAIQRAWSGPRADFETLGRISVSLLDPVEQQHIRIRPNWEDGTTLAPRPG